MKYAVCLPNFGPYGDARTLASLACDAEQSGWDGFFIWDHLSDWLPRMVDPWVALTAIALSTERIRIGALVTPLPRRRPWKVARETVSVDHLSNGRLVFGVGIGGRKPEWENLGEETDPKTRGEMLDEGLEVLVSLWSGETVNHEGRYYHVKYTRFLPKPMQQARIPIWVAGIWPNKAPFRRAARWDGAFPLFRSEGEEEIRQAGEAISFIKSQLADGRAFDYIYTGVPTPGDDPSRAAEIVSRYAAVGFTWWLENVTPFLLDGKSMIDEWPLERMHERILQGPPPF